MNHDEQTLLRLGLRRAQHLKLHPVIPPDTLTGNGLVLWNAMGKYYASNEAQGITDLAAWRTWFMSTQMASETDEDRKDLMSSLIGNLSGPINEDDTPALVNVYLQRGLMGDVISAIEKFSDPNNESDLDELLTAEVDKYKDLLERTVECPIENTSMDQLYAEDANDYGFEWRNPELRRAMRRARPGDAIVWAARPDRGKTTTLASEIGYMIHQLDTVFPGENKSFIWFNNEGDSKAIRRRLYQSLLGCKGSEMMAYHKDGSLLRRLHEAVGGEDVFKRIYVMSIHGYSNLQVLRLIKEYNPGLCVFDMVDNIRFTGLSTNGGTRTDQMLEEMYKWVRDTAIRERFAAFESSQISAEGEDVAYPPMSALKDSKTGKQGACDAIVMWGERNNDAIKRFLGIPKNKLCLEGQPVNPKAECWFRPDIARLDIMDNYFDNEGNQ